MAPCDGHHIGRGGICGASSCALCVLECARGAPRGAYHAPHSGAGAGMEVVEPAAMHGGRVFWLVKFKEGGAI